LGQVRIRSGACEAWSDVLHLCDAAGVTTIGGFDERFPLPQSLFNQRRARIETTCGAHFAIGRLDR
jgi:hypothetical protein